MAAQPPQRTHRERGQTLVLFVVLFSVLLAMAAFAVDQGLAFGKHGVAQNVADTAARAGAYGCAVAVSEGSPLSGACQDAEAAAEANADANLVGGGDVTASGGNECPGEDSDMPAMTVQVDREAPALFSLFFGAGNFTARARTVACLGQVKSVRNGFLEMIPAWMTLANNRNDPNHDYCGDPASDGLRIAGESCVLFSTDNNALRSAGLFRRSGNTACGTSNSNDVPEAITNGLSSYTCTVGDNVNSNVNGPSDDDILNAFQARLNRPDACSGSLNSRTAFGRTAVALGTAAEDGPDFTFPDDNGGGPGEDDRDSTIYGRRGCASPRLVLIPLVNITGGSNKRVVGFTAAYILGCYPTKAPTSARTTMNRCEPASRGPTKQCGKKNQPECDTTQVRVGMVRMFIGADAVRAIGPFGPDQWVEDVASMAVQTRQ